jgi:hypothetical protein
MADETSITNLALAKLGVSPVMSLDDETKQAQFAKRFFAQTRDEVMAAHRWNFAMRRSTLNRLADSPESGYLFAYQLPNDCLRVVQLNGYSPTEEEGEFSVEDGAMLTDAETAQVRYIARVEDGGNYPPLFVDALAVKLASRLAGPLTGSRTLPSELLQEFEAIVGPKARMADVFEEHRTNKMPWVTSSLVRSRFN